MSMPLSENFSFDVDEARKRLSMAGSDYNDSRSWPWALRR